jgi:hypothetical protein
MSNYLEVYFTGQQMSDFLATAILWASFLSGYHIPLEQPKVIPEPHSFFLQEACRGKESSKRPCNIVGLYLFNEDIYIDETLPDAEYNEVLVHELVHWLQHQNGKYFGYGMTCKEKIEREREAYAVEQRYITEIQHLNNKVPNLSDEAICGM